MFVLVVAVVNSISSSELIIPFLMTQTASEQQVTLAQSRLTKVGQKAEILVCFNVPEWLSSVSDYTYDIVMCYFPAFYEQNEISTFLLVLPWLQDFESAAESEFCKSAFGLTFVTSRPTKLWNFRQTAKLTSARLFEPQKIAFMTRRCSCLFDVKDETSSSAYRKIIFFKN